MTSTNERTLGLLEWAASETRREPGSVLREIEMGHDADAGWKRFLPPEIMAAWPCLTTDAKLVAFVFAFERFENYLP
jgi:hypothetical protein